MTFQHTRDALQCNAMQSTQLIFLRTPKIYLEESLRLAGPIPASFLFPLFFFCHSIAYVHKRSSPL
ncbi:hypothetical protein COCC4DRAFT_125597 [Bipolaris maydis ATCC 48331]|uniref:Uncharacterized protein n=2 Tax=Cochliobolus heterostrophus TaxID=5016 RepID=M2TST3_COCH5|nr:uncharacterized protein COCC4DRAFT_125597 [Bipolaris maydis ATCC 48331]EMD89599.1 hypothetical protein COCHEDRAFT_1137914 [Bipolaris maydis C5]ENI10188.1 hypothetical protein COCC4DRAFT_125597 [Bipolaris maydis ATCC 48331]KAJ6207445.1 hypothetical protein PSV09DRAFT_1137914 [Bipolaris maydis]